MSGCGYCGADWVVLSKEASSPPVGTFIMMNGLNDFVRHFLCSCERYFLEKNRVSPIADRVELLHEGLYPVIPHRLGAIRVLYWLVHPY